MVTGGRRKQIPVRKKGGPQQGVETVEALEFTVNLLFALSML